MDFLFPYNENKLKPYLKMAVQRIKLTCSKKASVQKNEKREVAEMLRLDKEEKARIRVEKIIREDFLLEAYEIVELLCELIHERIRYMSAQKECPPDLEEGEFHPHYNVNILL